MKVKVCGITTPEDARLAVDLGASWLGLNFHPPSPRFVSLERAREIAEAVAGRVPLVGVFVNRPPAAVAEIADAVGLDLVQFHGDEPAGEVARFGGRAIRVFRRDRPPSEADLAAYPEAWGFLFDLPDHADADGNGGNGGDGGDGRDGGDAAATPASGPRYGGTGRAWDWGAVAGWADLAQRVAGRPVLIAGGVTPATVGRIRDAARAAGPEVADIVGVDLCSGVEASPGHKDPQLLQQLFSEVRDG